MSAIPQVLHRGARAISVHEFSDAVKATCVPRFPVANGSLSRPVGIAISGGVDSMALAFLCFKLKQHEPLFKLSDNPISNFYGIIVDHRLREGSTQEAANVISMLKKSIKMRADAISIRWDEILGPNGNPNELPNIETLARQHRYRRLGIACQTMKIASLLMAHHEDDQYETVLMRLLSGHGYRGLQGMRPASDIPECYGLHGVSRSGFLDDQLRPNPFYNLKPNYRTKTAVRRSLREQIDPAALALEIKKGRSVFDFDDYDYIAKGNKREPPLVPMPIEDGGISIYRPLLEFGKDRIIATCVENSIPWAEDYTNTDPTFTMRNAVRHMYKSHTLPVALQKPAILRLAERCKRKAASEEAEADRLLDRVLIRDFEPNVGTAVVQLKPFSFLRVPRKSWSSSARRQRRLKHYRHIAALLIRRLLALVTPEQDVSAVGQLDNLISLLFPSLATKGESKANNPPKAYVICGVHFVPLIGGDYPLRWLLTRAPYASNMPRPEVQSFRLSFRERGTRHPRSWRFAQWDSWHLYDGRHWVRIRNRLPFWIYVAPFDAEHQKSFRAALGDQHTKDSLSLLLKRYAPGKVRYTLPAIYASGNIDELLQGGDYWPEEAPLHLISKARAEGQDPQRVGLGGLRGDNEVARYLWEKEGANSAKRQLLALPTLGIQLPGLENWLQWNFRYRKVDQEWLRRSVYGYSRLDYRRALRRRPSLAPSKRSKLLRVRRK
ncbi:hypothetical protein B0T25DRAFT_486194 [Lasiosphaeria hispida]|uniref:tRNA(Ile)-lysidine synthetase n=1 Tax=Lasiosphaeria hispida TaxID=260671 RepID=A0AAJ0M9L1_9PEZI|nr:hypothetical protein B0T25DRAFT_486194 [Lasiosphaeria hispida]